MTGKITVATLGNRFRSWKRNLQEPISITNAEFAELCGQYNLTERVAEHFLLNGFSRINEDNPWELGNIVFDEAKMVKRPMAQRRRMFDGNEELRIMQKQAPYGTRILTVKQWVQELSTTD